MTKEELEKKLKISEKTYIHCPTLELAEQVLNIFHQLGLKWCDETHYTLDPNWDNYKESTTYCPFDGGFVSLEFARLKGFKIINAEDFIALHTEKEEFDLKNYVPKGELEGFPKEIIARMLKYQVEQGSKEDISVFEKQCDAAKQCNKGFEWDDTKEGWDFWHDVISNKNFNLFFEQYPKKDNSQYFKVGDKVFYYITNQIGIIKEIKKHKFDNSIDIVVDFGDNDICEYVVNSNTKRPFLLHYRDDYDYSIINFNNLPKRQESKKWRAEKQGIYYCVRFDAEGWSFADEIRDTHGYNDNANYNSGNYFRTEIEAEIIAQKLNEYFKQLIQDKRRSSRSSCYT